MRIRVGYELTYDCPQETPMILTLNVHYSRASDVVIPDYLMLSVPFRSARIAIFSATANLIVALSRPDCDPRRGIARDAGLPDITALNAFQHPVQDLPEEALLFLLGSRYCETDRLSETAWNLFGQTPMGWARVQAICDFVHNHIQFGYQYARPTRTAWEAYNERIGVCRDYDHVAVTFLRCITNIPGPLLHRLPGATYGSSPYSPMDFAAWFECYLGGRWHTFDPRNNVPRIGRILIARGRDAADVVNCKRLSASPLCESFLAGVDGRGRGEFCHGQMRFRKRATD